MGLQSIFFLPHGGIIIPELERGREGEAKIAAEKLYHAMEQVGQEIEDEEIDVILLTSPHGYTHPSDIYITFNGVLEGWSYFQESQKVQQHLYPGNSQLSQYLYQLCNEQDIPVSPLIHADLDYPLKIGWGENIPLSFISDQKGPQVVLFSLPMEIPMDQNDNLIESFAKILVDMVEDPVMDRVKYALVVSGDLSHCHDSDHPYGFHEDAEIFDQKSVAWFNQSTDEEFNNLLALHETAQSCGIFGMGLLHNVMKFSSHEWNNEGVTYAVPTYFGMAISSWKPNELKEKSG